MKNRQKKTKLTGEKRIKLSEDIVWGINPVLEVLAQKPDHVAELVLVKEKRGAKWELMIENARAAGIKLSFVPGLKIVGEDGQQARHQGVVARMSQSVLLPFEQLLQKYKQLVTKGAAPRLIACDTLQDPHNLGAVIRSAHASGAAGVIITSEKSAPLSGTAAKAAAGAMAHIDICQVTNLTRALQQVKDAGGWIFGAVKEEEAQSLYQTDLCLPACIVVGSEGKGIRPLVRKTCDVLISIPMAGSLESLNSSVAAAVILFEALRQQMTKTS